MTRGTEPVSQSSPAGPPYFTTFAYLNPQQDNDGTFRPVVESSEKIRFGGYAPSIDQASESAKTTSKDAPSKSEEPLQPFFDRFFSNIAFVTQLGSFITFALVVSQLQDPEDGVTQGHLSDLSIFRILIAASWLIFTVTHILSFLLGFLKCRKSVSNKPMNEGYGIVALLYSLITAAFISLSLAVAAYVKVVGFPAVAMLGTLLSVSVRLFCLSLGFAPSSGTGDDATDTGSYESTYTNSTAKFTRTTTQTQINTKTNNVGDMVEESQKIFLSLPSGK